MQKRLTPNSAYRAVQYLAKEWYDVWKRYNFNIPEKKKDLREFTEALVFLIEETFRISKAPVMKPLDWKSRITEEDKEKLEKGEIV